jgi:hypothetical protein
MMRDILVLFEYERKRRPVLAHLANNIGTMSEEQISTVEVPFPWMREALLRLKSKQQYETLQNCVEQWVIEGITADPMGEMRQWQGAETYLKMAKDGRPIASLLITPGTLVWLDHTGMWIDTLHTTEIDPRLAPNTVTRGTVSRSGYILAVRDRACQGAGLTTEARQEPKSQVRFFRPG